MGCVWGFIQSQGGGPPYARRQELGAVSWFSDCPLLIHSSELHRGQRGGGQDRALRLSHREGKTMAKNTRRARMSEQRCVKERECGKGAKGLLGADACKQVAHHIWGHGRCRQICRGSSWEQELAWRKGGEGTEGTITSTVLVVHFEALPSLIELALMTATEGFPPYYKLAAVSGGVHISPGCLPAC